MSSCFRVTTSTRCSRAGRLALESLVDGGFSQLINSSANIQLARLARNLWWGLMGIMEEEPAFPYLVVFRSLFKDAIKLKLIKKF